MGEGRHEPIKTYFFDLFDCFTSLTCSYQVHIITALSLNLHSDFEFMPMIYHTRLDRGLNSEFNAGRPVALYSDLLTFDLLNFTILL